MFAVPCENYRSTADGETLDLPAHPARRPRAELLDQHGAHGRFEPSQSVRVDLVGHQRAVGPLGGHGGANQK